MFRKHRNMAVHLVSIYPKIHLIMSLRGGVLCRRSNLIEIMRKTCRFNEIAHLRWTAFGASVVGALRTTTDSN